MKDKFQSNKQQNPKSSQKSHNSKIKKNKNKNKPQMSDDNLLNEAIRSNKICAGNSCEQSTTLLGQVCPFCKKTFCLQHHMPEVHGCGSAAHSSARRQISRDGVLYNGSGVPSKKLPPDKHANLQRKLGSKLKEMEDKRKAVNKKK
uniref:DNA-binding protein SMUBP-2-like n=1 Tax=Styela clava TaxID=7725 RepID=UPI00193ADED2|nr:DNA-binding protein SMUBP-2-like [Styela clava]